MDHFNQENESGRRRDFELSGLMKKIKTCHQVIGTGKIDSNLEFIINTAIKCVDNYLFLDGLLIINSVYKQYSWDWEVWYIKGLCHSNLNQYIPAIKCFNRAIRCDREQPMLLIEKGKAFVALRKFNKAELNFRSVLKYEGFDAEIYIHLADLCAIKNDLEKAIKYLVKAFSFDKENSFIYFQLALHFTTLKNYSEALKYYDIFLNLEPENSTGWFNRGVIFEEVQKYELAISSFEMVIALNNSYGEAHSRLGNLYLNLGRTAQAINEFEEASKTSSFDETIFLKLGNLFFESRDFEKAIHNYSIAIAINRDLFQAYLNRAVSLAAIGNKNELLDDFRFALGTYPSKEYLGSSYFPFFEARVESDLLDAFYKLRDSSNIEKAKIDKWISITSVFMKIEKREELDLIVHKTILKNAGVAFNYYIMALLSVRKQESKPLVKLFQKAFNLDEDLILLFATQFSSIFESMIFKRIFRF